MKTDLRCLVVGLCLALVATACKKKEEGEEGATTEPATDEQTAPPEPEALTSADYAAVVQEAWKLFDEGELDDLLAYYATDASYELVDTNRPVAKGTDAVRNALARLRTAFPDLKTERVMVFADDKRVVTVDLLAGSHGGDLDGLTPTDQKIGVLTANAFTMTEDGKIAGQSVYMDEATLMGQLGVSPQPHREAQELSGKSAEPVIAQGNDTEASNLEAVRKGDAPREAGKPDFGDFAEDFAMSDQSMPADVQLEDFKAMSEMWLSAFSEIQIEEQWSISAGDYVVRAVKYSMKNTKAAPEIGLAKPTDKVVESRSLEIAKLQDGKISQLWNFANSAVVAEQLGLE